MCLVSLLAQPSLSPRAWRGLGQGSARFVTVTLFVVFATRGVDATLPASMAQWTCLMSSLMGMFEQNLVSSLVIGSIKPLGGIPLLLDLPSNRFPLNGDSMGSARG